MMLLFFVAHAAPCEAPVTVQALAQAQTRAQAAFRDADSAQLERAVAEANDLLPCVQDQLTTSDVGTFYRTVALNSFVTRDRTATLAWFQASRAAEPTYVIPDTRMAPSHPFRRLYDGTEAEPALAPTPVGEIEGWVRVDGRRTDSLPTNRPYIVQQFSDAGTVLVTALVARGGRPELRLAEPVEPVAPAPEPVLAAVAPPPAPSAPPSSSKRGVLLAAGVGVSWLQGPSSVYVQLKPQARLPLGKVLDVDVAATLSWTRGDQVYFVPMVRAGLTYSPDLGRTRPWVGAAAAAGFFNPQGPVKSVVMPGGGALLGLAHDLGPVALVIDTFAGWVGRPTVSGTVGVGVQL